MKLSIAIFAYNESDNIAKFLSDLFRQKVFSSEFLLADKPNVFVLANGCSDDTVEKAQSFKASIDPALQSLLNIVDLPQGGKSRTWNTFVHDLCPDDTDMMLFCDGDIQLPKDDVVGNMLSLLKAAPELLVVNSWPRKDTDIDPKPMGFMAKMITAAGGGLTNYKTTICGQLYMARASAIREISMPIGLPVEDGFVKAMLLTKLFSASENMKGITGSEDIWHVYESIATLSDLINHQVRIVIGSAINLMLFDVFSREKGDHAKVKQLLCESAKDESWISDKINKELPTLPHGYVPFHFVVKRIQSLVQQKKYTPKHILMGCIGFFFDLLVYLIASYKMLRGAGSGHW